MDLKTKKTELVDEFNKNNQSILRLQKRQDQILGALQLIQDIEKKPEEKPEEKEKKVE